MRSALQYHPPALGFMLPTDTTDRRLHQAMTPWWIAKRRLWVSTFPGDQPLVWKWWA